MESEPDAGNPAGEREETVDPIEALITECLDRMATEGESAVEDVCRRHPSHAEEILESLKALRELGLGPDVDATGALGSGAEFPSSGAGHPERGPMPERLGPFQLIRRIGGGGMGVVYLARQDRLRRLVAVKVLPPGFGLDPELRARFVREAEAAAKLTHPAVVRVYDFGDADGTLYLAMEWINGPALVDVPDRYIGDPQGAARMIREVADALEAAHAGGMIHRDVKPGNIILDHAGRPHLTDFGLARTTDSKRLTQTGKMLGTPGYMAPETVARGAAESDARSDVFGLGAVLYQMLAGKAPFDGATSTDIMQRVLYHDPTPLDRLDPRVPHDLSTVVIKAMEKDPERRYAAAGLMRADLDRFLNGETVLASRAGPISRLAERVRRRPLPFVAAASFAVVIAICAVAVGLLIAEGRNRREKATNRVEEATRLERTGALDPALTAFRQALELDPQNDAARAGAARLVNRLEVDRTLETWLLNARDRDALAPLAERIAGWDPVRQALPATVFMRAHFAVLSDEPDRAAKILDDAAGPESLALTVLRSEIARSRGRPDAEAAARKTARGMEPGDVIDVVYGVDLALADGDYPRVRALLRRARARWPRAAIIHHQEGMMYRGLSRWEESIDAFDAALAAARGFAFGHVLRGYSYLRKGDHAAALADFDAALEKRPGGSWAVSGKIETLAEMGKRDEALALADDALRARPKDDMLLNIRGYVKALARDHAAAIRDYEAAIAIDPKHRYALINRAWSLNWSGRRDDALRSLGGALEQPLERDVESRILHTRALIGWNDTARAEGDLRAAIERLRSPVYLENLALLLINSGRFAEAEPLVSEQVAADFRRTVAIARRGCCRWAMLDVARGIEDQDEALRSIDEDKWTQPWLHANRARAARSVRDPEQALRFDAEAVRRGGRGRALEWALEDGNEAGVRTALESDKVSAADRTLATAWLALAEKDEPGPEPPAPPPSATDAGRLTAWFAVRFASSRSGAIRAWGRALRRGDVAPAIAVETATAARAAARDDTDVAGIAWTLGRMHLAARRYAAARLAFAKARAGSKWRVVIRDHGISCALDGDVAAAAQVWRILPADSSASERVEIVEGLARHGLRAGHPALDAWLRSSSPFQR